jgi:hypothetical protein
MTCSGKICTDPSAETGNRYLLTISVLWHESDSASNRLWVGQIDG